MQKPLIALLVGMGLITGAQAACLTQAQVQTMADDYFAKKPTPNFAAQSDKDAACTRARFNKLLAAHYGKVVGYKAGLTNPATQKRFNTNQPTWGVLYDGMIQPNGYTTAPNFGARPLQDFKHMMQTGSRPDIRWAPSVRNAVGQRGRAG